MKIATLDLTPELFIEFCKFCKAGPSRRYLVKENALPEDAEVVQIRQRYSFLPAYSLQLVIKSEMFADVAEGDNIPELPPIVLETLYDESIVENLYADLDQRNPERLN